MKFTKLLKVTSGKNHGIYETDGGSKVRKPLGQRIESYWDAKSVLVLVAMFIGAALILSLPVISWYKTRDLSAAGVELEKEEVVLDVEVLEGDVLYETNDTVALTAPAKYKIVRAVYGDDCFYNLAGRSTYGSGEDVISVKGSYQYTYKISCQPFIGRGGITSYTKTVIVLEPAEIRAPEVVLLPR